jgi:DNA (cytosine-5)-methyltransferase 1
VGNAYYNEIDPEKAEWIRELIKAGVVASGDVDERSIADVQPDDLRGYTQCHFFAGISVWSYALRLAGWQDDRAVWTGSCPCPSFSCAGKGEGFADPRHLWSEWHRLIRKCRPGVVFGEQVAAAIGHGWLDLVCGDMEAEEYAIAQAVLGAHSAGAPHIRQRLYFVADLHGERLNGEPVRILTRKSRAGSDEATGSGEFNGCRDCDGTGNFYRNDEDGDFLPCDTCGGTGVRSESTGRGCASRRPSLPLSGKGSRGETERSGDVVRCADTSRSGGFERGRLHRGRAQESSRDETAIGRELRLKVTRDCDVDCSGNNTPSTGLEGHGGNAREWRGPGWLDPITAGSVAETGATSGFWGGADWWYGRDGKYRPIGPGLFPLATGSPARVLRLRGYGDAICAESAAAFIGSYREVRGIA